MADIKKVKVDEDIALMFVIGGLMGFGKVPFHCRNVEALYEMGLISVQLMGFAMDVCLNDTDRWKMLTEKVCNNVGNICHALRPSPSEKKEVSKE